MQGHSQKWLQTLNDGIDMQMLEMGMPDCISRLKACAQEATPVLLRVRLSREGCSNLQNQNKE